MSGFDSVHKWNQGTHTFLSCFTQQCVSDIQFPVKYLLLLYFQCSNVQ